MRDLAGPDATGRDEQRLGQDRLEGADEPGAADVRREHLGGARGPDGGGDLARGETALDEDRPAAGGDGADLEGRVGGDQEGRARVEGGLGRGRGGDGADADQGGPVVRVGERGGPGDGLGPAGGGGGQLDRAAAGGQQGGGPADGFVHVGVAQHRQQALGGQGVVRVAGQEDPSICSRRQVPSTQDSGPTQGSCST